MDSTTQNLLLSVEAEIDRTCLSEFIAHVADICNEKAIHLEDNWQDPSSAKVWERAAHLLMSVVNKVNV